MQLLDSSGIVAEILLASDKDDRETSTEVHNFGNPL